MKQPLAERLGAVYLCELFYDEIKEEYDMGNLGYSVSYASGRGAEGRDYGAWHQSASVGRQYGADLFCGQ